MKQRVRLRTLLVLAFATGWLLGDTPASAQTAAAPTFRAEAEYVEVDAVVTDQDGHIVRNLTRDDFRVFENGRPQDIVTFLPIDLPDAAPAVRAGRSTDAAASDVQSNTGSIDGRLYAVVLDDLHIDAARSERVKQSTRLFIEQYVTADDRVALFFTGRTAETLPFTSNKALLLDAVDTFFGRKLQSATLARNERYAVQRAIVDASQAQGGASGAVPEVRDPYEEERAQNARTMLASLRRVSAWFGAVHGRRKTLVFVSEGIDYDIDQIIRPRASTGPQLEAMAIAADIRETLATVARANVSIYGIDPRGLTSAAEESVAVGSFAAQNDPGSGIGPGTLANELRLSQESLRWLGEDSGGFAAVNRNDMSETFARIVRDNSSYYVLAYYPNPTRSDGTFHRITVEMKRPQLTVQARRGYVASSTRSPDSRNTMGLAPELHDALNSSIPLRGLPMRAFAVPLRNTATDASVVVGVELAGDALSLATGSKLDVSLAAFDTRGRVFGPVNDTLTLNLRQDTRASVEQRGIRLLNRLTLPNGRYQLHVAAHDREKNLVGSVVVDLEVPEFDRQRVGMSALLVASNETASVLTARTDQALASVLSAPPTAARVFARDDELAVFAQIYDNSGSTPHTVEVVTSVTADAGGIVFINRATRASSDRNGSVSSEDVVTRVPLAELAPGDYILAVEATSQLALDGPARRTVRFTVAPPSARAPVPPVPRTSRAAEERASPLSPEYLSLLTQYRSGDVQGAISSFAQWPSERVRAQTAADTAASELDVRLTQAAVMLHSDVAMFLAGVDPRSSRQQLQAAQSMAATLPDDGPSGFRQRWQAYAIGPFLIQHDLREAQTAVDAGVGRLPRSADLLLMKGTLIELAARSETTDFRGNWSPTDGINRMGSLTVARIEDALVAAANAYGRALELDPSLTAARLRLGWVYGINHSNAHAREQLRLVANDVSSRDHRYLAHLFLGGLADGEGNMDEAYAEYEAARAIFPDAQSASIALMRAARLTGRTDLEQELLMQYPARPRTSEDPWWYFSMGFDTDLVAWLHARAIAP